MRKLRVRERVDSDHESLTVWVGEKSSAIRRRRKKKRQGGKGMWTEKGRKSFKKYFEKRGADWGEVDEDWRSLRKITEEALRIVEKELKRWEKGGWWDVECRE